MPQDLIGCWNHLKLKALICCVAVRVGLKHLIWMILCQRREDFAVFFVLRSCGKKICISMCHGNSENRDGCPYLRRICLFYGTNVSVSRVSSTGHEIQSFFTSYLVPHFSEVWKCGIVWQSKDIVALSPQPWTPCHSLLSSTLLRGVEVWNSLTK